MLLKLSPRLKSRLIMMIAVLLPMGASLAGSGITGEPGSLFVEPAELDFGAVEIGDTAVMTATVANAADPGADALTLAALDLDSGETGDPTTIRVSFHPDGSQFSRHVNRGSVISADGRYVAFSLELLVPPYVFPVPITFRRDVLTGATEVVSINAEGDWFPAWEPVISPDGRYIAFHFLGGSRRPIPDGPIGFYVRDMDAGVNEYIDVPTIDGKPPNGSEWQMDFSADFRIMAFTSVSTNFVPEMGEPFYRHLYVYDRDTDTVELVSETIDGTLADEHIWSPEITPRSLPMAVTWLSTAWPPTWYRVTPTANMMFSSMTEKPGSPSACR